ncbi:MAG: GIN domain-containing protein [Hyphococcus sp.]
MRSVWIGFAAGLALSAQALAGETRTYDLPEFDWIDASAGVVVVADVGGAQAVEVETDRGDFRDFKIEVDDRALTVSRKWSRLSWHGGKAEYKVRVSVPELRGLDASSGAYAKIKNLSADRFIIDLSSGAKASLEGACEACVIDLSSGADLNAKTLTCEEARIEVSSGGNGYVNVTRALIGEASSGGYVAVYGNPSSVDIDKSSGGRIKVKPAAQASRD